MKKIVAPLVLILALVLSGCSIKAVQHADAPAAEPAPSVVATPAPDPLVKGFGKTVTYTDGVTISVSAPTAYAPTQFAAGTVDGQNTYVFTVVVTNGSAKTLDLSAWASANSGGKVASSVADLANNIGLSPSTSLLTGQSVQWDEAFSVADANDITFQISPDFLHDKAIFDSKH
jgi:hypothetical protein